MLRHAKGFTLIEVLISLMIFGIGMTGVAALQISSINKNAFAGNLSEAVTIGISKVDTLMSLDYSDPSLTDTNGNGVAGLDAMDGAADHFNDSLGKNQKYSISWNISQDDPVNGCKFFKIQVKWVIKNNPRIIKFTGLKWEGA